MDHWSNDVMVSMYRSLLPCSFVCPSSRYGDTRLNLRFFQYIQALKPHINQLPLKFKQYSYTDPVPPSTNQYCLLLTQYHHISFSNVRLSFVDLRWAQLYVSLVTYMSCLQRKWASFHQVALDLSACPWIVDRQQLVPAGPSWSVHVDDHQLASGRLDTQSSQVSRWPPPQHLGVKDPKVLSPQLFFVSAPGANQKNIKTYQCPIQNV